MCMSGSDNGLPKIMISGYELDNCPSGKFKDVKRLYQIIDALKFFRVAVRMN